MQLKRCFDVSIARLFFGGKTPEPIAFVVAHNGSDPFAGLLVPSNAFIAGCISAIFTLIALVIGCSGFPQIAPSVVARIAIYMVNMPRRPFSSLVCPYDVMGLQSFVVDSYQSPMICTIQTPGYRSGLRPVDPRRIFPAQNSGFWIIRKIMAHHFWRKIMFSHGAVTSLCGERLAAINGRCGPRHYITGLA